MNKKDSILNALELLNETFIKECESLNDSMANLIINERKYDVDSVEISVDRAKFLLEVMAENLDKYKLLASEKKEQ